MNSDRLGALAVLLLSTAYTVLALAIETPAGAPSSGRTYPLVLGTLGAAVSLLLLLAPGARTREQESRRVVVEGLKWKPALGLVGLMLGYGLAMPHAGFFLSTLLFLNLGSWVMGERRLRRMLYASLVLVGLAWLVLSRLLEIQLAPGSWFGLVG